MKHSFYLSSLILLLSFSGCNSKTDADSSKQTDKTEKSVERNHTIAPKKQEVSLPKETKPLQTPQSTLQKTLFEVIKKGDKKALIALVKKGVDVNLPNEKGERALTLALSHEDLIPTLLDVGADVNAKDASGILPLTWAIYKNKPYLIALFLDKGANPNLKDFRGYSAMNYAFYIPKQSRKIILSANLAERLIKHGGDIDVKLPTRKGEVSLFLTAVLYNNQEVAEFMIKHGLNVNGTVSPKYSYLSYATRIKNVEAVKFLLLHGANAHQKTGNKSALEIAQTLKHQVLIDLLSFDLKTLSKESFIEAIKAKRVELADYLLTLDQTKSFLKGCYTPLMLAYEYKLYPLVLKLIDHGDKLEGEKHDKDSVLFKSVIASSKRNADAAINAKIAIALINKGADVNRADKEGRTPLFYAYNYEVYHALVSHHADVNKQDKDGNTALHYTALRDKRHQLYIGDHLFRINNHPLRTKVEFLIYNKADLSIKNRDKKTPLDLLLAEERLLDQNTVNLLIKQGVSAQSFVPIAVKSGRFSYLKNLEKQGANILKEKNMYLHRALLYGADISMITFYDQNGAQVDKESSELQELFIKLLSKKRKAYIQKFLMQKGLTFSPKMSKKAFSQLVYFYNQKVFDYLSKEEKKVSYDKKTAQEGLVQSIRFANPTLFFYYLAKGAEMTQKIVNDNYKNFAFTDVKILNYIKRKKFSFDFSTTIDKHANTALHSTQKLPILEFMVENGANINVQNKFFQTPFESYLKYARNVKKEMVDFYLSHGALLKNDTLKSNVLHWLSLNRNVQSASLLDELMKEFKKHKVDFNLVNSHKKTPLFYAARNSALTAYFLLREGAKLTHFANDLILLSLRSKMPKFTKLLVEKVKSEKLAINFDTALYTAVVFKDYASIALFLQNGADINAFDSLSKQTPLHLAIKRKDPKSVKILLDAGADPYLKDGAKRGRIGMNAFEIADYIGNKKIIKILQEFKKSIKK